MTKQNGKSHPGNKHGLKLKNPNVRQEAYDQYCVHIASGLPKESFFFDHPKHSVCWRTMEKYISENPSEFPPIKMEKARAHRYMHWLEEGRKLMTGKYKGGSPTIWQTCMRNLFRDVSWDREQLTEDNKSHVEKLAQALRSEALSETEASDNAIE